MKELPASLYFGHKFDTSTAVLLPRDASLLPAIWAFCRSKEFHASIRAVNQKLSVDNGYLTKIPFDLEHWQKIASEQYPNGLPEPHSDDPTQWLFAGHPKGSTDPLQVAVARLLGYRWPEQEPDDLDALADRDGIVPIPAVRGERPAAERLLDLLRAAMTEEEGSRMEHGSNTDEDMENVLPVKSSSDPRSIRVPSEATSHFDPWPLLAEAGCKPGTTLDDWLRDRFFEQHCKRFHNRPFVWHIWDGRKDGFACLVNYHTLTHKALELLTYSYLQDWITAQSAAAKAGKPGADLRLQAAQALQETLKLILAGEPPHDIFVRWKPIDEQPIGWNPDLNDGVRLNIRPFLTAGILRKNPPSIKWTKDRGKEPPRDPARFPWFNDAGERVNDVHLTNAEKHAARLHATDETQIDLG